MRAAATFRRLATAIAATGCAACSWGGGDDGGSARSTPARDDGAGSARSTPAQDPPRTRFATIDERRGRYGPAGIGDTVARVREVLGRGRRAGTAGSHTPTGMRSAYRGPTTMNLQHRTTVRANRLLVLRYPDVSVYFIKRRVVAFMLTSPGARTRREVGIGTPLARAKRLYPGLRCGSAGTTEPFGGFPACTGRIRGGPYIWLGGDPIENITVSTRALFGV